MQHRRAIDFSRYYMHYQAKVNIFQDFKFEEMPPVQIFTKRKPLIKKPDQILQMRVMSEEDQSCYQSQEPD